MSVLIHQSNLTPEIEFFVRKTLTFFPESKEFVPKKQQYYHNGNVSGNSNITSTKDPILFWTTESHDIDGVKHHFVRIPLFYSQLITGEKGNVSTNFKPSVISFTGSLLERQINPLNEALEHLHSCHTTSLFLHCGWGKTIGAAWLSTHLSVKRLVIFPRIVLGKQWLNTFRKVTNAKVWLVGSKDIPDDPDVILCMYTQFEKIPLGIRSEIGCLILDEADRLCIPTAVRALLGTSPKYAISCTATPDRVEDSFEKMFKTICGDHHIKQISVKPFNVYRYDTKMTFDEEYTDKGVNFSKLTDRVIENKIRNDFIIDLVIKNKSNKFMLITSRQEHAMIFFESFKERKESVDYLIGTKSEYKNSRILITGYQKAGVGFDEESACQDYDNIRIDTLILCTSIKNAAKVEQAVGRVFRSYEPKVIDIVDSNKCLKRHWTERKKWYVSRNGIITERRLTELDIPSPTI